MTDFISQHWPDFLFFLGLQVLVALAVRTFPDVLGGSFLRTLEHRNTKDLAKTKDDLSRTSAKDIENLRADFASLRAATDYLSANQAELRSRMIDGSKALWDQMVALRREFGAIVNLESIFLPNELADMYEHDKWKKLRSSYAEWQNESRVVQKLNTFTDSNIEGSRLFVGDRLWLMYYAYRAVLLRTAMMTQKSFENGKYLNWRMDDLTRRHLQLVLTDAAINEAIESDVPALAPLLGKIEALFLKEAMRIMTGSAVLADSISDVQATLAYEKIRLGERVNEGDAQ